MQEISLYLYPNTVTVFTNLDTWNKMRYRKVYNHNLKLFGGADNKIKIQVRNVDQKPVNLTGFSLVMNIISRETKELILQKNCVPYDITQGTFSIIFGQNELLDIESGLYDYAIVRETRTTVNTSEYLVTSSYPLYGDPQYDAIGTLEILSNVKGGIKPSVVTKEWVKKLVYNQTPPNKDYWISGIVDAQPQFSTPQTLHSFQIYMKNYTGEFKIEGSLSEGGNPGTWVTLSNTNYVNGNMDFKNITGKWNFFRFQYIPTSGTVDKILYR